MITTSGRSRAASSMAAATLPASPTMVIPSRRFSRDRRPSLTTSWSSTMRSRKGLSVIVLPPAHNGDLHRYQGTLARGALHRKASAQSLGTLHHVAHSPLARTRGPPRRKAHAVVRDDQAQDAVPRREARFHKGDPHVLLHFGQGLLCDMKKVGGLVVAQLRIHVSGAVHHQVRFDETVHSQLPDERGEGAREASRLEGVRAQVEDVVPDVPYDLIEVVD